ncbi:Spt20 family-domain-containing protein [Peziza echinospora]|nr:Spt20 family-domain-containing protein [Peziza echinospora]
MSTTTATSGGMLPRIKINPKPTTPSASAASNRPLNKANSVQLPGSTPHRPSPTPAGGAAAGGGGAAGAAGGGGGSKAARNKAANSGSGPGRGKSRPSAASEQNRKNSSSAAVNVIPEVPQKVQTEETEGDALVLSQTQKKLSPQPYVRTTEYILRKYKNHPPSLILHLHPSNFRFDGQDGSFSYTSPMRTILEYIRNETIPHEVVEEFRDNGVRYYEGCLIVQIFDHRSSSSNGVKNSQKDGHNIPASLHNHNEYLTPSPFVPHSMKEPSGDAGKQADKEEPADRASAAEVMPNKPRVFTTVLHPTPASLHAEIQMLASTPMRVNALSRTAATPTALPSTPTALTINTSASGGRPAKRVKMWLDDKTAIPFEAAYLQATNASLILTPATCIEHAQHIIASLRHPAHNAPPPKPKTRKRTTAELAADEAQAAEEERILLIMDERHQPPSVAGGAPTSAVATNDGAGGGTFEPSFKKFKTIELIKAKRAEEKRLAEQQRLKEASASAAAAGANTDHERRQREARESNLIREKQRQHNMVNANGSPIPMGVGSQAVQALVLQSQMAAAAAANAANAAAAQASTPTPTQAHPHPHPPQPPSQSAPQAQPAQAAPQPASQPQASGQTGTPTAQAQPPQPPQPSQPQQQQQPPPPPPPPHAQQPSAPQEPQPASQQSPPRPSPAQQPALPGQMQFNSSMQPQQPPPMQPPHPPQPQPQQAGHPPAPPQPQAHAQQHQLRQDPNIMRAIARQEAERLSQIAANAAASAAPLQAGQLAAQQLRQQQQQHAQLQHAQQQHLQQQQLQQLQQQHIQQQQIQLMQQQQAAAQTPRMTSSSPNLIQRNPSGPQPQGTPQLQTRTATPQPGHQQLHPAPHSLAPHQSPALASSQPISSQSSPRVPPQQVFQLQQHLSKQGQHPIIKPNPGLTLGQQSMPPGSQGLQQSPPMSMASPNPNMLTNNQRAMQAANRLQQQAYLKMAQSRGAMMGPPGQQQQFTQQQIQLMQQQHAQQQAALAAAAAQQFANGQGQVVMPNQFQDLGDFQFRGGMGRGVGQHAQGIPMGMSQQQIQLQHQQQLLQNEQIRQMNAQIAMQNNQMNGGAGGMGIQGAGNMQNMQMMMGGAGGMTNLGGMIPNANMMNMMNGGQGAAGMGARGRGI